jgi:dTDP-4-amino-4,6-dideoxygalactose transaminase
MKVPFMDLKAQYLALKLKMDAAIADCLENSAFVQGKRAAAFEREFATYLGVRRAVGCGNGTDAIYLALRGLGVGPGHEVIVPANTFIATAEAVTMAGADVVFCDVDPRTNNMGPEQAKAKITGRTKALLPVHLYGFPADLVGLRAVADQHGLKLVSDSAQAHGAKIDGCDVAQLSDVSCYSFYPGKNLGAIGDAGAVATDDEALAERVTMMRNHGRKDKYIHDFEGVNMRLDEIQAAVLMAKLPNLEGWTQARVALAEKYASALAGVGDLVLPAMDPTRRAVYHLFVVETGRRDALRAFLSEAGVSTGIHYPVPLPLQPAYARLNLGEDAFPASVSKARRILSLPMFPEMTAEQQDRVVGCIRSFFSQSTDLE